MMRTPKEASHAARVTGLAYLAYFLVAFPAGALMRQFASPHDASVGFLASMSRESLFRLGISLDVSANVLYLALSVLLYGMLVPVGRRAALFAVLLGASGCSVQLVGDLFQSIRLAVQSDDEFARMLEPRQLEIITTLASRAYTQTYYISLVLFGVFDVLIGWLIARSNFLPRLIGVFWVVAGVGWLCFLWPPLAVRFSVYILAPGALAELVLMLWLLVKGVDQTKWRQVIQEASH